MITISSELYEKHDYLLKQFLKRKRSKDNDYLSFMNVKYCELVNRYYNSSSMTVNIQTYIRKALPKCKKEYFRIQNMFKKEISVDPTDYEEQIEILDGKKDTGLNKKLQYEGEIMNHAMLEKVWLSEVGHIDLKSDLLKDMDYREICFLLLSLNSVIYERIAQDFKCSLVTVKRVISAAKAKVKENALKLGYKV